MPAAGPAAPGIPEWVWPASLVLALAVLLWTCRGALLGTAVADDYTFLYRLRFQRPLDPFDSMGAAFYWRPVGRQLYFSLVGPWLLEAPFGAFVINTLILAALGFTLYRVARRGFEPPVAAAIAAFPLLSEPVRVLIGWPSGAQHLLASAFAAAAIHETLAGRRLTAAAAALLGVLSHELAALVLPLLPLIAWSRARQTRDALRWGAVVGGVAVAWAAGYAIAFSHGVVLPKGQGGSYPIGQIPRLLGNTLGGALNLENVAGVAGDGAVVHAVLVVVALAMLVRGSVRTRMARRIGVLCAGAIWFLVGALPLGMVEDWNAWRAWMPSLGFGFGVTALCGLASPWLAGAFVALRLATLLLSPIAPSLVHPIAPETASQMSYVRITRLQRTVESTRRELAAKVRRLPRDAKVRYWWIPRLAEFGFQGSYALRVWYRDTTLTWEKFGGSEGYNRDSDAIIEYVHDKAWPALADDPAIIGLVRQGRDLMQAMRFPEADSMFLRAIQRHGAVEGGLYASLLQNRSRVAFNMRQFERADSLNHICLQLEPSDPDPWTMVARIALVNDDRDGAESALRTCLGIDPKHKEALSLAKTLGMSL